MAFSNTYDTTTPGQGSGVSNREDLTNIITRVVPERTPVYSMARKTTCSATFHEWTVDKLKAPSSLAGGVSEGADATSFSDQHEDRARLGNYIQGVRDTWSVSRLQAKAAQAGGDPVALAKAKATINVKLGCEYLLVGTQDRQAETGAGTPYKMRGLGDWLDASGPSDVPSDYRTPAASVETGSTLTEAELQVVVRSLFSASGEVANSTLVAGTTLRSTISGFTRTESSTDKVRTYNVNEDATSKKLTYAVTYFDTDFGMLTLMNGNPDCMPSVNTGYIMSQDMYYVANYLPISVTDLEDQGGGRRGLVEAWMTLAVKNPRGFAKFTG